MPFAKPLPSASSLSRVRALRLIDQHIASERTSKPDDLSQTSLLPFPRQRAPRRTIRGAVSRLMAEVVAFSAHAGSAFPSVPIAILSWLMAEFLVGCAGYAQAMYPIFPLEDEEVDRNDPIAPAASHPGIALRARPGLTLVSATAERGVERDEAVGQDRRWK
jgi:hypothetical protein